MPRLRSLLPSFPLALLLACGGGGGGSVSPNPPPPPPPPPPAPAPVATVAVTPGTNNLVPQQTVTLAAETKDANGNVLTGRTITWATSSQAVATVSAAGVVTAVAGGNATITATSEGKAGTATVSVADGGQVGTGGSTVTAANGDVKIVVPAGAVPGPMTITVTPNSAKPTGLPVLTYGVGGTHYTFGPEGTTFGSPVTVTMKYDPAKLPVWAVPTDLAIYHFTGGNWVKLPGLSVDPVAHTLTATTTSFSPFVIATGLAQGTLTPGVGATNWVQRSAQFTASIPNHTSVGLTYVWSTSGNNGVISPLFQNQAQYTMTQAQPVKGDLDVVQVVIRGAPDPAQPNVLVDLASAVGSVTGDLTLTYFVTPDFPEPDFAQQQPLDAVVKNPDGSIYSPPPGLNMLMVWTSDQQHGDLDIHNPNHQTDVSHGVYTAKTMKQSVNAPPRIDEVKVDFYQAYRRNFTTIKTLATGLTEVTIDSTKIMRDVKSGSAHSFVEVAPKTFLATFQVRTTPTPAGFCKTAVALVPKVVGATSYLLKVTGIVNSPLGVTITKTITGATNTGSIMDVFDGISYWGVPLDGGCGGAASSAARETAYNSQFGPATFEVKTTP